jgi:ABC-2 type transport system ATP-binding protein
VQINALVVENLKKSFVFGWWPFTRTNETTAVKSLTFQIKNGDILGFLGPNGAGKTTTIQMLLGTLTPTAGKIEYFGQDFSKNRTELLKKIGYASGYERLPPRLSVTDNLDIIARFYDFSATQRAEQIEKLLTAFNLWEKRDTQTGALSAGQQTRVMLAKAFMGNPSVVLLDEPTASLDPDIAREVRSFILAHRAEYNTAFFIASHNMDEVTQLCDQVLVVKSGEIIANSSPKELAKTISQAQVHLTMTENASLAITFLNTQGVLYKINGHQISITIDESAIAWLLSQLGTIGVNYSNITIDKPSLEDYFLHIAQGA